MRYKRSAPIPYRPSFEQGLHDMVEGRHIRVFIPDNARSGLLVLMG